MRVYLLPPIFIQMVDAPLIPAFREAHVRGEHEWLRTAFWRVTKVKMVIGVVGAALYLVLGNFAAKVIGGQDFAVPREIWVACGFLARGLGVEPVVQRSDDRRRSAEAARRHRVRQWLVTRSSDTS